MSATLAIAMSRCGCQNSFGSNRGKLGAGGLVRSVYHFPHDARIYRQTVTSKLAKEIRISYMKKGLIRSVLALSFGAIAFASQAAPYSLACPQLVTNSQAYCTVKNSEAGETLILTASNDAIYFWGGGQIRTITGGAAGSTSTFTILSGTKRGQVTVCVWNVLRTVKTCSITRVN
jgi:hypothetical protein